eukprot:PLAT13882.1.p1 GENE.PLAT13882.1~~PLAT13882.1.p1  ORF type:complete len:292 (-),score=49.25 PLAT13882.1:67-915(-)
MPRNRDSRARGGRHAGKGKRRRDDEPAGSASAGERGDNGKSGAAKRRRVTAPGRKGDGGRMVTTISTSMLSASSLEKARALTPRAYGREPAGSAAGGGEAHPPTKAIRISGLKRPFRPAALLAKLREYGAVAEDDMQFNGFQKSVCWASFDSVEAASSCQASMDGHAWPEHGGQLRIAFEAEDWKAKRESAGSREQEESKDSAAAKASPSSAPAAAAAAAAVASLDRKLQEKKKLKRKAVDIDAMFKKTAAEPKLYWLPVASTVVAEREAAESRNEEWQTFE